MGLDSRFPFMQPSDVMDPNGSNLQRFNTTPPLGCQYMNGANPTITTSSTNVVLDLATASAIYDPYNMIDTAANRINLPVPGIWRASFTVLQLGIAAGAGEQFVGLTANGANLSDRQAFLAANTTPNTVGRSVLTCTDQVLVTRSWINTNIGYKLVAFQQTGVSVQYNVNCLTFWLDSAVPPGKY